MHLFYTFHFLLESCELVYACLLPLHNKKTSSSLPELQSSLQEGAKLGQLRIIILFHTPPTTSSLLRCTRSFSSFANSSACSARHFQPPTVRLLHPLLHLSKMATGPRRSLRIQSERRESENGTKRENDPMLTPPATPSPTTRKRKPSQSSKVKKEDGDDDEVKASNTNGKKTTAEKKIATLRASLAQGPFPNHRLPTEGEALRVAEVLTEAHGYQSMPKKQPPRGDDRWGGCGDV